ncbi:MAG: conjugal transfer protein [Bacillaceae bacterium]
MSTRETVRTYNAVWKTEKVLYGIQDIALPIPITYRQIGFFIFGLIIMYLLNKVPPISLIDFNLVKFVLIPGVFSWYFTQKKLDGKLPHKFILRVCLFHFGPNIHNRYKEIKLSKKPYKYHSYVGYRQLHISDDKERKGDE